MNALLEARSQKKRELEILTMISNDKKKSIADGEAFY
jgi:hypothetical protein